jgi:integrase
LPDTTPRKPKSLSAAYVHSIKSPGKYHDGKGTGLFLLVKKSGARSWVQRLMVQGKRRELGLGSPPFVTLSEARNQALDNKRMVVSGRDPLAEQRKTKLALSFEEAARKTHIELAPTWKNPKDRAAFLSSLERYVFPRFGNVTLSDVSSADIRQAILTARAKAPGVAKKLTYRISSVFRWGIAEGHCVNNPSTSDALALPRDTRTVSHRKALHYSKVSGCIETVKASGAGATTKLALEFLILTATRSGETRMARWEEFDLELELETTPATWTVPAERMKMKRPHRIPLSDRAVKILMEARELSDGSDLVFFGTKYGKPLSDMTLSKLVKELGFDADVHGFRTSFRTWGQEQTDFPREVQEAALGHKVGDAAEQAYARSDLFHKRKKMMERWSRFLGMNQEQTHGQESAPAET